MRFSEMILADMIDVLLSAYSTSYCLLSSMWLLLGFQIVFPSSSTALFLTLANCNPSSYLLLRPSFIPRYGSTFPISVTSNVLLVPSMLRFAASTSSSSSRFSLSIYFRYLLLITQWNLTLNSSSSSSRQNRLGCGMSCIVSFRSMDSIAHFFGILSKVFHPFFVFVYFVFNVGYPLYCSTRYWDAWSS